MREEYEDLRHCIYSTESELRRFRQIVLSVVLATDIFDKELNDLRKARWYVVVRVNLGNYLDRHCLTLVVRIVDQEQGLFGGRTGAKP